MDTQHNSQQSLKAHLIRATHQWCTDMGYTPYMVVLVDDTVRVPAGYVQNHTIVLNTGYESTNRLEFTEHFIEFQARFNGVVNMVGFPYSRVLKVYAKETQVGYDAIDAELIEIINRIEQGADSDTSTPASQIAPSFDGAPHNKATALTADAWKNGKPRKKTTLKRIK